MENTNINNECLDWDSTIEEDGQQIIVLEEGDYNFLVTSFERGSFPGGNKIPACNKATMTVQVNSPKGLATVKMEKCGQM